MAAISGDSASPYLVAVLNLGNIPDFDRHSVHNLDRNVPNGFEILHKADTPDKMFFRAEHEKLSACITVVFLYSNNQVFKGYSVLLQCIGVDTDLVL